MDTLVTREILTNFTSLNGQMSCNGLSAAVVKTPTLIKQLISYEAMEFSGWLLCKLWDDFIHNNLL